MGNFYWETITGPVPGQYSFTLWSFVSQSSLVKWSLPCQYSHEESGLIWTQAYQTPELFIFHHFAVRRGKAQRKVTPCNFAVYQVYLKLLPSSHFQYRLPHPQVIYRLSQPGYNITKEVSFFLIEKHIAEEGRLYDYFNRCCKTSSTFII